MHPLPLKKETVATHMGTAWVTSVITRLVCPALALESALGMFMRFECCGFLEVGGQEAGSTPNGGHPPGGDSDIVVLPGELEHLPMQVIGTLFQGERRRKEIREFQRNWVGTLIESYPHPVLACIF